jgi:hypothetical protein
LNWRRSTGGQHFLQIIYIHPIITPISISTCCKSNRKWKGNYISEMIFQSSNRFIQTSSEILDYSVMSNIRCISISVYIHRPFTKCTQKFILQ